MMMEMEANPPVAVECSDEFLYLKKLLVGNRSTFLSSELRHERIDGMMVNICNDS